MQTISDDPQPERQPERVQYSLRLPLERAWSCYVLLALIIVIWVVPALLDAIGIGQSLTRSLLGPATPAGLGLTDLIQALGMKSNQGIYANGEYYRLLTAIFLHGGIAHIGFNSYALYALGPEAERLFGTARFLTIYFLAGLAGSLASYRFNISPSLGASGAIFGLIGALGAFYYVQRRLLGEFSQAQLTNIGGIAAINLLIGFTLPGIDNWGHLGGLVCGAVAGLLLAPRFAIDARFLPPQVVRRSNGPLAWLGALGILALLAWLAVTIVPPL